MDKVDIIIVNVTIYLGFGLVVQHKGAIKLMYCVCLLILRWYILYIAMLDKYTKMRITQPESLRKWMRQIEKKDQKTKPTDRQTDRERKRMYAVSDVISYCTVNICLKTYWIWLCNVKGMSPPISDLNRCLTT